MSSGVETVSEGTVTFTVFSGTTVIGSAVSAHVVNGSASANYVLPAGTTVGSYIIVVVFDGGVDFGTSDSTQSLTISPATTSTVAESAAVTFNPDGETVTLMPP